MEKYKVTRLLNQRLAPVNDTADKSTVITTVNKGFIFESTGSTVNNLGVWYRDKNNFWYWGAGVEKIAGNTVDKTSEHTFPLQVDNLLFTKLQIDKIWNEGEFGELANVAILDSGISYKIADLTGALGHNIEEGFLNAGKRFKNFLSDNDPINDNNGHGSHCAGLIASRNTIHTVGIAKKCNLYAGKITDIDINPSIDTIIKGIRWAAGLEIDSPQDIDIISMSCGSLISHPDLEATINEAIKIGKILIFSIGNKPSPMSKPTGGTYPALCEGTISVGAVDMDNNFQAFSYINPNLTVCAPGLNILSYGKDGNIMSLSGTSQSTAICAGVAALLVSKLKKRNEVNIPEKVMAAIMGSPQRTIDGFTYRYLQPYDLYKSI